MQYSLKSEYWTKLTIKKNYIEYSLIFTHTWCGLNSLHTKIDFNTSEKKKKNRKYFQSKMSNTKSYFEIVINLLTWEYFLILCFSGRNDESNADRHAKVSRSHALLEFGMDKSFTNHIGNVHAVDYPWSIFPGR